MAWVTNLEFLLLLLGALRSLRLLLDFGLGVLEGRKELGKQAGALGPFLLLRGFSSGILIKECVRRGSKKVKCTYRFGLILRGLVSDNLSVTIKLFSDAYEVDSRILTGLGASGAGSEAVTGAGS